MKRLKKRSIIIYILIAIWISIYLKQEFTRFDRKYFNPVVYNENDTSVVQQLSIEDVSNKIINIANPEENILFITDDGEGRTLINYYIYPLEANLSKNFNVDLLEKYDIVIHHNKNNVPNFIIYHDGSVVD
jgi:hypothetical protein